MEAGPYSHVQTSPFRFVLPLLFIGSIVAAYSFRAEFWAWFSLICTAIVLALVSLTMMTLAIEGEPESLHIQFGPLPLFSMRVPYADIREVRVGRSRVIDGWGIHFLPGRGWTWSLWGFDCVDITRHRGQLRIGSDDAQNLALYLQSQIQKDHAR